MIEELYCGQCDNDESFILEYYNTLIDSETMRDVVTQDEFQAMLDREAGEEHIVRVDCVECANIVYQ